MHHEHAATHLRLRTVVHIDRDRDPVLVEPERREVRVLIGAVLVGQEPVQVPSPARVIRIRDAEADRVPGGDAEVALHEGDEAAVVGIVRGPRVRVIVRRGARACPPRVHADRAEDCSRCLVDDADVVVEVLEDLGGADRPVHVRRDDDVARVHHGDVVEAGEAPGRRRRRSGEHMLDGETRRRRESRFVQLLNALLPVPLVLDEGPDRGLGEARHLRFLAHQVRHVHHCRPDQAYGSDRKRALHARHPTSHVARSLRGCGDRGAYQQSRDTKAENRASKMRLGRHCDLPKAPCRGLTPVVIAACAAAESAACQRNRRPMSPRACRPPVRPTER